MGRKVEILQIIPADGWYAEFRDGGGAYKSPLACWTLYRDTDGETYIGGATAACIEGGQWCVEDDTDFEGFTRYAGEE